MSVSILIDNFDDINIKETTKLNADAAIGVTALTVAYGDNIAAGDYINIGRLGAESSEIRIVNTGPTTTSLPITVATGKSHSRFDDIASLFGNQIKIYRAPNSTGVQPADTSFVLIATFAIDYDQTQTSYTDPSGDSTYWYKFTYYNSTTTGETALADSIAVRGGDVGNYASIQSIREKAGMVNNRWITDARIDQKRQAAQQLINSKLAGMYTLPFTVPINAMIAEITRLLAAGWLLTDNYGPVNTLNTNEGQSMINQVTNDKGTGLLDRLNSKDLVITDVNGTDTSIPGTGGGVSFWPDTTTATSGTNGTTTEPHAFTMGDRY